MTIVLVVVDSGGIGAAPDADRFGDAGADTLGHALAAVPAELAQLDRLGLGRLYRRPDAPAPAGAAFRVHPAANGKDTLAGHWEMMGVLVTEPFPTYPHGFPPDVVARLEAAFGRPLLGNRPASGTAIIEELGPEHLATGSPIVYTSADSVLQIAAHEEVVPVETLYAWCEAARRIMSGPHRVGRVIARPFRGVPGQFVRTPRRHDWPVAPPPDVLTRRLVEAGVEVVAVGKIGDIFAGEGITSAYRTVSNADGLARTLAELSRPAARHRLVFTNLVDFDSLWGHRRDPAGYVGGLQVLDAWLKEAEAALGPDDQLWLTADHGCDPTWPGSDHTREDVPWLIVGPRVASGTAGERWTLADIGATLAEAFDVRAPVPGQSVWRLLTGRS